MHIYHSLVIMYNEHTCHSLPGFWTAYLSTSSNGLHTSCTVDHHLTVFVFVKGGEGDYLQCWVVHIFEDGHNEMFFDADHELIWHLLPVSTSLIPLPILEQNFYSIHSQWSCHTHCNLQNGWMIYDWVGGMVRLRVKFQQSYQVPTHWAHLQNTHYQQRTFLEYIERYDWNK